YQSPPNPWSGSAQHRKFQILPCSAHAVARIAPRQDPKGTLASNASPSWDVPMKQIFRITLCALLLAVSNLTAQTFEGTVHMKMTAGKEGPHQLSYSIKGSKLRTEIQAGNNMSATAI